MDTKGPSLIPYLHFEGKCEEALNFYKDILKGKIDLVNRYDNPALNAPEHYKNKILHARLHFGDSAIYGSDVFPGQAASNSSGDVALSLSFPDPETGQQVFEGLAEGGVIAIPFQKQFWSAWHGNLTDKYGIRWMVNA